MKKKLIITAHDFGLCRSVNEGIIYVLESKNNTISEVALLPNAPGSADAARYIRETGFGASLCLNLTTFKPISKVVKTLVGGDGKFLPVDIANWNFSNLDRFDDKEVANEIRAQWDWYLENVGSKPNAIVTRKSESGDPKVLLPLVNLAKSEKVPIRSPFWKWKSNYAAQSYVDQSGVKQTDNVFIGLKNWGGKYGYDLEEHMDILVEDVDLVSGVSELIVFPGFVDEELFKISTLSWQRGQFVQLTKRGKVSEELRSYFDLVNYKSLVGDTKFTKTSTLFRDIVLHQGKPADVPSMIEVNQNDGFVHAYALPAERLENLFLRGESFVVAKHDEKIIGFGSIDCEIRARIHFLSVRKDYSGIGVGTAIMKALLDLARSKGYKKVHTIVESKSTKEIFLKKMGFTEIGFYKDRYALGKDASMWETVIK